MNCVCVLNTWLWMQNFVRSSEQETDYSRKLNASFNANTKNFPKMENKTQTKKLR